MTRKITFTALALAALLVGSVALAQTNGQPNGSSTPPGKPLPVIYPIAELGGCASKDECRAYCDLDANHDVCFAYAQTHGLMSIDAIQKAREFLKDHIASTTPPRLPPGLPPPRTASSSIDAILAAGGGPGGCTSQSSCKTYCDDQSNATECLQFAQDHALMTPAAITLAKKLLTQVGPGGCQGDACKTYCNDSTHQQVCIAFAQQNGFISKDDAAMRMERMNLSSTTPPFPSASGEHGSSTLLQRPPPPFEPREGTSTHPLNPAASSSVPRVFKDLPNGPPPPPPHPEPTSNTGESSSIFFSVLHFFGI